MRRIGLIAALVCLLDASAQAQQLPTGRLDLNPGSTISYFSEIWFDWTLSRSGSSGYKRPLVQVYCEQPSTGAITYSAVQYADVQDDAGYHFYLYPSAPVTLAAETICFATLVVRKKDGPLWAGPVTVIADVYFYLR